MRVARTPLWVFGNISPQSEEDLGFQTPVQAGERAVPQLGHRLAAWAALPCEEAGAR